MADAMTKAYMTYYLFSITSKSLTVSRYCNNDMNASKPKPDANKGRIDASNELMLFNIPRQNVANAIPTT